MQTTTMAKDTVEDRRAAFGSALADAMAVRRVLQRELAEEIGMTQSTVSEWVNGGSAPEHDVVFRLEKILELPPGHLSSRLGYLPPDAVKSPAVSFEELVTGDDLLDETHKRILIAAYREAVSRRPQRGRPNKKR